MEATGGDRPEIGDRLVVEEDLKVGDYAYFRRLKPHEFALCRLKPWMVESFEGQVFQIQAGDRPGSIRVAGLRTSGKE